MSRHATLNAHANLIAFAGRSAEISLAERFLLDRLQITSVVGRLWLTMQLILLDVGCNLTEVREATGIPTNASGECCCDEKSLF